MLFVFVCSFSLLARQQTEPKEKATFSMNSIKKILLFVEILARFAFFVILS